MALVQLESVSKVFPARPFYLPWLASDQNRDSLALKNIFLQLEPGEIVALLGPNGSGKTTLLKLIAAMLLPDTGRVLIEGLSTEHHAKRVRRSIGYVIGSERSFYPRLTARENLQFFGALEEIPSEHRAKQVDSVLQAAGLQTEADRLIMKFSSGMLQRLGLARALLKNPPVLLLDEPGRSLDPVAREQFWALLRFLAAQGTAILVATHDFGEAAQIADRVAVLCGGVLTGTRALDSDASPALIRDIYMDLSGEDVARALHLHHWSDNP